MRTTSSTSLFLLMFEIPLIQKRRIILHVDADAFFASVEQVLNPKLKGKPVLVGGPSSQNGIVSAASYEAKKFGITSGMPTYLARRKCPQAIFVTGNFEAYRKFSKAIYNILANYTPDTEMASIDEAYLDITGCEKLYKKSAPDIARAILMEIHKKTGLSVSCGLASSKTVAKVASSTNKPHKLTIVPYGREREFLYPLHLRAIPGIGPRTFSTLERCGLERIGQLSDLSLSEVFKIFGIYGIPLWKRACGIDNTPVVADHSLPKSISKEHTFYESVTNKEFCIKYMKELSELVFTKLRSHELKARTVFIKIRYLKEQGGYGEVEESDGVSKRGRLFEDVGFQQHIDIPTAMSNTLFNSMRDLFLKHVEDRPIRLIGIGVSGLSQNYNLSLFNNDNEEEQLFCEIDRIKKLYGQESISYGA